MIDRDRIAFACEVEEPRGASDGPVGPLRTGLDRVTERIKGQSGVNAIGTARDARNDRTGIETKVDSTADDSEASSWRGQNLGNAGGKCV